MISISHFKELQCQLDTTITRLSESQPLCKLLTIYQDGIDPVSEPDIDTSSLFLKNIFPFPRVPDIQENEVALLNFWFDNFKRGIENPSFKNYNLTIEAICHNNLWAIKGTGIIRPYAIMHEVDKLFNKQRGIGIGKTSMINDKMIIVNNKFSGYRITYEIHDQM